MQFSRSVKIKKTVPLSARRDRIVHSCMECIDTRHKRIMVGLSGGADSCALLGALCVLRDRGDIDHISAVHVCHNIRVDCEKDVSLSMTVADGLGCDFSRVDIFPLGQSGNIYDICRNLRYEKMTEAAIGANCSAVAVAHHLNDQLETMIFRLARGSTVEALSGMRIERVLDRGVNLIRPLLRSTRIDCERMCRKMKIEWINDPSNENTDRTRAFIRHEIVPLFRKLNPRIEMSVDRVIDNLQNVLRGIPHGSAKK